MKTVSGKVISSKPISLSRAASTLSSFISTDTAASQALCAYLRRASASFNELKQLHKELRSSNRSDRKHRKPKSETITVHEYVGENPTRSEVSLELNRPAGSGRKIRLDNGNNWNPVEDNLTGELGQDKEVRFGVGDDLVMEGKRKKDKKKKNHKGNLGRVEVDPDGNKVNLAIDSAKTKNSVGKTRIAAEEKPDGSVEVPEKNASVVNGNVEIDNEPKKHQKKKKKHKSEFVNNEGETGIEVAGSPAQNVESGEELSHGVENSAEIESERKKHKKKNKKKHDIDNPENHVEAVKKGNVGILENEDLKSEERKKTKRKKEVGDEEGEGLDEQRSKKKRRRKS